MAGLSTCPSKVLRDRRQSSPDHSYGVWQWPSSTTDRIKLQTQAGPRNEKPPNEPNVKPSATWARKIDETNPAASRRRPAHRKSIERTQLQVAGDPRMENRRNEPNVELRATRASKI